MAEENKHKKHHEYVPKGDENPEVLKAVQELSDLITRGWITGHKCVGFTLFEFEIENGSGVHHQRTKQHQFRNHCLQIEEKY